MALRFAEIQHLRLHDVASQSGRPFLRLMCRRHSLAVGSLPAMTAPSSPENAADSPEHPKTSGVKYLLGRSEEQLMQSALKYSELSWKNAGDISMSFSSITRRDNCITSGRFIKKGACRCLYALASSFGLPKEDSSSLPSEELGPKIDLNLPRRSLQISFTCNACGVRSQRLINPNAYARGTVFVQCAGCGVYHKLVDNLGLIEEYDFRLETDTRAKESGSDVIE